MHEALYYIKLDDNKIQCQLCPWNCELIPGQTGNCKVRTNEDGKLYSSVYNKVAALGTDPIEKKPLYHFFPGKNILSIGEVGCNLHCSFCQNHRISQCLAGKFEGFQNISSEKIIAEALKTWNNIGIAYTYNEPFTFYEFLYDIAKLAKKTELKNVVVSNGYINKEPLKKLLPVIDAFNIDLKSFTNSFYKQFTKGKLEPVLDVLKLISKSGIHLEITNLVITGLNDNELEFEKMVKWIVTELGEKVPLHLSRYFPQHKMNYPPTSIKKLVSLYEIAQTYLQYVYLGNISDEKRASTFCINCSSLLVKRDRYQTKIMDLDKSGKCKNCNADTNIIL